MKKRAIVNDECYIQTDIQRINYFKLEQKVYKYAREFFKEAVPYFNIYFPLDFSRCINDEIIPLYCFDKNAEIIHSLENNQDYYVTGGLLTAFNQAVIRIGLDPNNNKLTSALKRTIRHEICHYCLWLIKRGYNDNDLDFWCYAYIFDAKSYSRLHHEDKEKFEIFKKIFDKYIKDISYNSVKVYTIHRMMEYIEGSMDNYEEKVIHELNLNKERFIRVREE